MIGFVVSQKLTTIFECNIVIQNVALCFWFAFMASHSFPTLVGNNSGCVVTLGMLSPATVTTMQFEIFLSAL